MIKTHKQLAERERTAQKNREVKFRKLLERALKGTELTSDGGELELKINSSSHPVFFANNFGLGDKYEDIVVQYFAKRGWRAEYKECGERVESFSRLGSEFYNDSFYRDRHMFKISPKGKKYLP